MLLQLQSPAVLEAVESTRALCADPDPDLDIVQGDGSVYFDSKHGLKMASLRLQ